MCQYLYQIDNVTTFQTKSTFLFANEDVIMFKLIVIVILWVYNTIPFGFNLFWHFLDIISQLWYYFQIVWLRITDEGSVPEMRIWSILLILIPIQNGVYIFVEVPLYINTGSAACIDFN